MGIFVFRPMGRFGSGVALGTTATERERGRTSCDGS